MSFHISKDLLLEEYVNKKFSAAVIAAKFGTNQTAVFRQLKNFNIPIRKPNEKARMIGIMFWDNLYCEKEVENPHKGNTPYYFFKCNCGESLTASGTNVRSGKIKRCNGCSLSSAVGNKSKFWKGYGDISATWWKLHIERTNKSQKIKKLKNTLTIEQAWDLFVNQNKKCKISGRDLYFPVKCTEVGNASLDRIDSSVGYIETNVQWVHKTINIMKNTLSNLEFLDICKEITIFNNKHYEPR